MENACVRGSRGLLIVQALWLVASLGSALIFRNAADLFDDSSVLELAMKVLEATWLLLDVAMVVALWPFIVGRRGTRAYRLAQTALVLIVAAAVVAALSASPTFGGPRLLPAGKGSPTSLLHLGLFYGFHVCFWLALVRATSRATTTYSIIYFTATAATACASVALHILPPEAHGELLMTPVWGEIFGWGRVLLGAVRDLMAILVLLMLFRGETSDEEKDAPGEPTFSEQAPSASRDLVFGGLWLAGGLLVTVASYSASAGGGRYIVTTGAIAYGVVRLVRGLLRSSRT